MKTRDVVIGFVILVVLIAGALVIRNARNAKTTNVPLPTPNFKQIESKFPSLTVPANADRINLNSVNGATGMGESFRTYSNDRFSLTIMADLSAPKAGYFYQGWIANAKSFVSLGKLSLAKGGYLSEFGANKDYSDYKKVVVTLEKVYDATPETHVLEGSF